MVDENRPKRFFGSINAQNPDAKRVGRNDRAQPFGPFWRSPQLHVRTVAFAQTVQMPKEFRCPAYIESRRRTC
jgi:hypothetical protein